MTGESAHYPIRIVSELTGINPVTLRAWERRYGLIKPMRTPKGHRLYTPDDIALIREVLALLESGVAIGQARSYLERKADAQDPNAPSDANDWQPLRQRLFGAITSFKQEELDRIYNEALSLYPIEIVTEQLLKPTLRSLGKRWQSGRGGIAEEHFFTTYMRNKLGARLHHMTLKTGGPKLIAACMPGEQHDLGLLLYCVAAAERTAYRFIILGANTPLDEINIARERSGAAGILLSGSITEEEDLPWQELATLASTTQAPLFIGGRVSLQHHDTLRAIGAIPLGIDTAAALRRMGLELPFGGKE